MMEAAMRTFFNMLNIDPDEVREMVLKISEGVSSMEAKITDIQNRTIDIQQRMTTVEEILEITATEIEGSSYDENIQAKRTTGTN
jgi:peptidoglycan hydrolase CwlO-like protein